MAQVTSDAPAGPSDLAKTPGSSRAGFPAWAALMVVWVVWGSTYLAIRVADRTIPPFAMAGTRYLAAGAVLYPLAWLGSRRRQAAAQPATPLAVQGPAGGRASSRLAQWAGMAVVGTLLLAFGNGGVSSPGLPAAARCFRSLSSSGPAPAGASGPCSPAACRRRPARWLAARWRCWPAGSSWSC